MEEAVKPLLMDRQGTKKQISNAILIRGCASVTLSF